MKNKTKRQIKVTTVAWAVAVATSALAGDSHVNGYTKKNATYVAPHQKTAPDKSKANNYSTKGNTNPNTARRAQLTLTRRSSSESCRLTKRRSSEPPPRFLAQRWTAIRARCSRTSVLVDGGQFTSGIQRIEED